MNVALVGTSAPPRARNTPTGPPRRTATATMAATRPPLPDMKSDGEGRGPRASTAGAGAGVVARLSSSRSSHSSEMTLAAFGRLPSAAARAGVKMRAGSRSVTGCGALGAAVRGGRGDDGLASVVFLPTVVRFGGAGVSLALAAVPVVLVAARLAAVPTVLGTARLAGVTGGLAVVAA